MVEHEVLFAAFVGVESAHAYSAVLPSIFTIRTFAQNGTTAADIRDGELIGTAFALALGGIVSKLIGSWLPLIFAAVTAAVMISIYEWALRTAHQGT